jgi:hypothetical protein
VAERRGAVRVIGLTWGHARPDRVLLLILFVALLLRVQLASTQAYIHDESNTSIPLSKTISFAPGDLNLPLRGQNHGALPAYVVKVSTEIFGPSRWGYRGLHVLLGLATIALLSRLVRQWYGVQAARWTAALLAFNEYYLTVSSHATAHVPHLFFVALALYAFSRFLAADRAAYLYGAGAAVGVAFYCKETSALLMPIFFLAMLRQKQRHWFRSPHLYLACLTFAMLLAPDLLWNARTSAETARVTYSGQSAAQATYRSHLSRVGGLGLSPYPLMFYGRDAVQAVATRVTGQPLKDETPEYRSVNVALGVLFLGAVLMTTVRLRSLDALAGFLLIAFWAVFGFFTLIAKGNAPGQLDPVSWIWVETTMLSASVLAGARLVELTGAARIAVWACAGAALLYASATPVAGLARLGTWAGQETVSALSHAVQVLATDAVAGTRARPLWALGIAIGLAFAAGILVGFAGGWLARRRRRH